MTFGDVPEAAATDRTTGRAAHNGKFVVGALPPLCANSLKRAADGSGPGGTARFIGGGSTWAIPIQVSGERTTPAE